MNKIFLALFAMSFLFSAEEDPYLWLEEVRSEQALTWVKQHNLISQKELEQVATFQEMQSRILAVLNSKGKLVQALKIGAYGYHFWRDEGHVKGIYRRTKWESYVKGAPQWETVLDLDVLSDNEKESWVFKGIEFLFPEGDRALFFLSRDGKDAVVVREFDLRTKEFVQGGFEVGEAKTQVCWKDANTLYIATDFGEGSLTSSGYPRRLKEWSRSTPLNEAPTLFTCGEEEMGIYPYVSHQQGKCYEGVYIYPTFFTNRVYLKRGGKWVKVDVPLDIKVNYFSDHFLFTPKTDWDVNGHVWPAGSVLAIEIHSFLKGDRKFTSLFTPDEKASIVSLEQTKNFLIVNTIRNLKNEVFLWKKEGKKWKQSRLEVPPFGEVQISGVDANESDGYFLTTGDYLTPTSLSLGDLACKECKTFQTLPAWFSTKNLKIEQFEAISKDGTLIPYFQVSRNQLPSNGKNPTLLYGYGGFQVSLLPNYSAGRGIGWLERGGVFVQANIRGGGEFGPKWHDAARKENRQKAFDDFIAVAEDLIRRKVTSPEHLGIQGGSNGGLLIGACLVQRPDLFKAALCQVPLLDMLRYHKLLAGASWIDEYGNPDQAEERIFLQKYSPYHNIQKGIHYPRTFFTTSTCDDRVHPAHARKMAAKLQEFDGDVLYYENIEGGHAGAAQNNSYAYKIALEYSFLQKELIPFAENKFIK